MTDITTRLDLGVKVFTGLQYWLIDSFTLSMAREGDKFFIARLKEIEEHNEMVKKEIEK